ncbi:hypothetical protein OHR68_05945 [Spirillospora sp. NBC_00431]
MLEMGKVFGGGAFAETGDAFTVDRDVTALGVADGTVHAAFTSGTIVALNALTGAVCWSHRLQVGAVALSLTAPWAGPSADRARRRRWRR